MTSRLSPELYRKLHTPRCYYCDRISSASYWVPSAYSERPLCDTHYKENKRTIEIEAGKYRRNEPLDRKWPA